MNLLNAYQYSIYFGKKLNLMSYQNNSLVLQSRHYTVLELLHKRTQLHKKRIY